MRPQILIFGTDGEWVIIYSLGITIINHLPDLLRCSNDNLQHKNNDPKKPWYMDLVENLGR